MWTRARIVLRAPTYSTAMHDNENFTTFSSLGCIADKGPPMETRGLHDVEWQDKTVMSNEGMNMGCGGMSDVL